MSNTGNLLDGKWPWHGTTDTKLEHVLRVMRHGNKEWDMEEILGFPSMSPHPIGIHTFNQFQSLHTNTILTHTRGRGEKGFDGAKNLERDVIGMVGNLLGDNNVDGYITPGGTEANIMGLWIGREKLRSESGVPKPPIAVLASPASHYSLWKTCNVLDFGEGEWSECSACVDWLHGKDESTGFKPDYVLHIFKPNQDGSGLHLVPCDRVGQIDIQALERSIRSLYQYKGIRCFIIFANEGTTLTGAMDDTVAIGNLITNFRKEWGDKVNFYYHVDAAYGGLIYPFTQPDRIRALQVPEVNSVTVDPYKMGQCPIAEGIFLCRKDYQKYIQRSTGYVQEELDDTLCGSRSGAYAAACWAVFRHEGTEGFTRLHATAVDEAKYLHSRLENVAQIELIPQQLNMVAFYLSRDLSRGILKIVHDEIVLKFLTMWSWFNTDPENHDIHPRRLMKCNITRDVHREWVDSFVDTLGGILGTKQNKS